MQQDNDQILFLSMSVFTLFKLLCKLHPQFQYKKPLSFNLKEISSTLCCSFLFLMFTHD